MSCKRFEDPAYEEQCVLAFVAGDPPDGHVASCADCHAALESYAWLRAQLRGLARPRPRPGWKDVVRTRVRDSGTLAPNPSPESVRAAVSGELAASSNAKRPPFSAGPFEGLGETQVAEVTTAFEVKIETGTARVTTALSPWAEAQWQSQSDLDSARQALVRQIVEGLDDQARTMLRLRFRYDKSDGEIAGILGRDVSAVRATMRWMTRRIALSLRAFTLRDRHAARTLEAVTLWADDCVIHDDLRKLLTGRQEKQG